MKTLDLIQGSEEWQAARAKYFTASEAPAMLGLSKYQSRQELLRQKATGHAPEVSEQKQRLFDRGHEAEAAARPIVEEIIGDELFPATGTLEVDGLPLLASFDGITMDESLVWENKLFNASLVNDIESGALDNHYWPQLEQQLLVSGADKAYFTTSDGTPENTIGMWYQSVPKRRAQLIAGWKQFAEDLSNYQHVEAAPQATAAPIQDLPALAVQIVGHVAASNLTEWKSVVTARIQSINSNLQNDQDFVDADKMVKFLEDGEKKLDLVKSQAQSQAVEIDETFRAIDEIKATMRSKRLELSKLVEKRKVDIRAEIMQEGKNALALHIGELNRNLGRVLMPPINADFAGVMKSKKNIDSLRDAVSGELARCKSEASELFERIQANLSLLDGAKDHAFLFNDSASLVTKAPDDLMAIIKSRIADHKEAEAKRLEQERERIRREEQAKAEREQQEKAAAEKREAEQKVQMAEHERLVAERAAQREEAAKAEQAKPEPEPITFIHSAPANEDSAWKIAGLVSTMTDKEKEMVLHYCERVIAQRKEAA